jgi:predicted Rdx family selenoprotein
MSYEYYSQALINEEDKWLVRAKWIEEVLQKFREDPNTLNWVPWMEAKVDTLADLDVLVNQKNKEG